MSWPSAATVVAVVALSVTGCSSGGEGGRVPDPTAPGPTATVASSPTPTLGPATPTDVPPPPYNRWIRPDTGRFEAYLWDDRRISDAAKAAQPLYDPRWKPFSDCMVAHGFDVRNDPRRPFGQADLDEVVARANAERPDTQANKLIGSNVGAVGGIAGAFLACAGEWLAIPRSEWPARGIRELAPGELPEP